MIRATLAVCVLLASILVLSQNLIQPDNAKTSEPRLIEIPVDGLPVRSPDTDDSTAYRPSEVELVDHAEPLVSPDPSMLAQRWGGRSNLRSRMRRAFSPSPATPSRAWEPNQDSPPTPAIKSPNTNVPKAESGNPDDMPMAEIGKPIEAPPAQVRDDSTSPSVESGRYRNSAPTRRAKSRNYDEVFGESGIIDPADPSHRLRQPTPARTPQRYNDRQNDDVDESTSSVEPKSRYFDADWYQPASMTSDMRARKARIDRVLSHYYRRPLNSKDHSPWSLMHTMVAWGSDSYIRAGGPSGRTVGTVHWLANNGISDGVRLLYVQNGRIAARTGPGVQGHDGQLLAMLAQTRVRASYPLSVDGQDFTVQDLVDQEKKSIRSDMELTFKLIGLSHYLAPDEQWRSSTGTRWSIPKLINAEIAAPINGVTCGGTHRLMGLKYAVRMRRRAGMPVDGEFARAEKYTTDYVNLALKYQNDDGSFSSNFWRGRGTWGDNERKLKTSGHILEYVIFSVPHDQLRSRQVTKGVDYLTSLMIENRMYDWPKGPIGHAIRALSLYNERVFNVPPGGRRAALMAKKRAERAGDIASQR